MIATVLTAVVWFFVVFGAIAWAVSAVAFGLWIGRAIRNRDAQTPRGES